MRDGSSMRGTACRCQKEKARTPRRRAKNFQGVVLQRRTEAIVFQTGPMGFARTQLVVNFLSEIDLTYVRQEMLRW
jgi:hypothetical protein